MSLVHTQDADRLNQTPVSAAAPMPVTLYAGGSPIDTTDPVPVTQSNPTTVYSGQQTSTASAVALPSQALTNGVVVKALQSNTGTVYIGPSGVTTSTGYPLKAGEAISFGVTNLSAVFIIGSNTTDVIAFTGN